MPNFLLFLSNFSFFIFLFHFILITRNSIFQINFFFIFLTVLGRLRVTILFIIFFYFFYLPRIIHSFNKKNCFFSIKSLVFISFFFTISWPWNNLKNLIFCFWNLKMSKILFWRIFFLNPSNYFCILLYLKLYYLILFHFIFFIFSLV